MGTKRCESTMISKLPHCSHKLCVAMVLPGNIPPAAVANISISPASQPKHKRIQRDKASFFNLDTRVLWICVYACYLHCFGRTACDLNGLNATVHLKCVHLKLFTQMLAFRGVLPTLYLLHAYALPAGCIPQLLADGVKVVVCWECFSSRMLLLVWL